MSDTLLGVIVGGLLSGIATWITLALQHRKWRTEFRVSHLRAKRDRLEATCERVLDQLGNAMMKNSFPSKMMSDIDFLLPEDVSKIFDELMADKEKDDLAKKGYYYRIARAMKKSLKDLDEEIDQACLGAVPIFKSGRMLAHKPSEPR